MRMQGILGSALPSSAGFAIGAEGYSRNLGGFLSLFLSLALPAKQERHGQHIFMMS